MSAGAPHIVRLSGLGVALLAIVACGAVGTRYYGAFLLPHGSGMYHLMPEELAYITLFTVFGGVALLGLILALHPSSWLQAVSQRLTAVPLPALAAGSAALLLGAGLAVATHVLEHAVISDDEHAYRFIAQTLRTGSLTAPSPGSDLPFFREQFIVLDSRVRYGKYPIGYPLLLAAGQALRLEGVVVPLLTALTVLPLAWIGSMVFDRTTTALACLLFAVSPQVLLTGGTLLSQPASALAMLLGLGCLLKGERARHPTSWFALGGLGLGYAALVRPLPGVLFGAAALAWMAAAGRRTAPVRLARRCLAFAIPLAVVAGMVLVTNKLQSGSFLSSGYQEFHTPGLGSGSIALSLGGDLTSRAMSMAAAFLRLSVWLLGWPLAVLACALGGWTAAARPLWVMVAAAWAYRLVAPKAGVGGAGPLYMFEIVPLLCLLAADGLRRLGRLLVRALPRQLPASPLPSIVLAGLVVNVTLFLPPRIGDLRRMAAAQHTVTRLAKEQGLSHAVVFHDGIVPPWVRISWAYFPRCNAPALDDDILFVRLQRDAAGLEVNRAFWRRRYPDRSAWVFAWRPGDRAALMPLEEFLAATAAGGR